MKSVILACSDVSVNRQTWGFDPVMQLDLAPTGPGLWLPNHISHLNKPSVDTSSIDFGMYGYAL